MLIVFIKFKLVKAQLIFKLPVNLVIVNILLGPYIVAIVYASGRLHKVYIVYGIV